MHGVLIALAALLAGVIVEITARATHRKNRNPAPVDAAARSLSIVAPGVTGPGKAAPAGPVARTCPRRSGARMGNCRNEQGRESTPPRPRAAGGRTSKPCALECIITLNRSLMTTQAGAGTVLLGNNTAPILRRGSEPTDPETAPADCIPST